MNKSLESIVAPLENISSARDEHKVLLCNGQDAVRENTLSCNMSNITHTALQPNETTDSGIISTSGQSSSNYQDYNTSPVGAYTGDLVKYSSSSSSGVESENEAKRWMHSESQEHNRLTLLIHPTQPSRSGANAACYSDNSQSWTATESGYVTEPGDTKCEYESDSQDHAEALVHPVGANAAFNSTGWTSSSEIETGDLISKSDLDFGTTEMLTHVTSMCDHVHPQCAQNSIDTSGILEQDEMNDDDDDMALTLDGSTNDHLNTNTDSIEHNIGVNERATQSQVTNENVELDYMQASRYITQTQSYGGMNTNTALMLMPDISGSSLSIMCDIES